MNILASIDKINWSLLHHAYGEASDVPGLLRGLLSENEDKRNESLYDLCGTIWHQGTVYEASPYAVPILLKMLESSDEHGKAGIALLVAELADGTSALEFYADERDELSRKFKEYIKQEGRDFEQELEYEKSTIKATRKAVEPGIELLSEYLKHKESEVREGVARALARFPNRAVELIPLLEEAFASEKEDYVRDTMDAAIAEFKKPH